MQKGYEWLEQEPGPKMILEAIKLLRTQEGPGKEQNEMILSWAEELGISKTYSNDEIPWCGLLLGVVAKRAGKTPPAGLLWALNWAKFGHRVTRPGLGDVIVIRRGKGGHVFLYVGEDKTTFHGIGGNQGDSVSIARFAKERLYAIRRPNYIKQPENVRQIFISKWAPLSTNEV